MFVGLRMLYNCIDSIGNKISLYISWVFFQLHYAADTEKFYTEVQEIILARYNKAFDWSLKAKMMGKKAIESARIFVEETGISDSLSAEDFLVEREAMLQSLFPTSDLMPGFLYCKNYFAWPRLDSFRV